MPRHQAPQPEPQAKPQAKRHHSPSLRPRDIALILVKLLLKQKHFHIVLRNGI